MKSLTESITGGMSSFLGTIGSSLGNEVSNALFGRKDRMSLKDWKHNQNLLDYANPLEIAREQERLQKLTPTQAESQNTFLQMTMPVRAQMDKQYADTMFPGTTAWERLGSGAAPTAMSPGPQQSSQTSGFLTGLTPLITSKMAADTQLATTAINAQTSKEIAGMNNETALKTTGMQTETTKEVAMINTNMGKLPVAQTAQVNAQKLLTLAQEDNTYAQALKTRNDVILSTVATIISMMPETTIEALGVTSREKKGWQQLTALLPQGWQSENAQDALRTALKALPQNRWEGVAKDVEDAARLIVKGGKRAWNSLKTEGRNIATEFMRGGT